jgi:protein-histidine pros-kinase
MSLLLRTNLALAAVFILAAAAAGWIGRVALEANARHDALAQAGLMMDSALAIRAYTSREIVPLLDDRMKTEFLPQSVPFYAAAQNFLRLRDKYPQYAYKEATLNPTNPRDRAADWESDIIQRFRNDPAAHEMVGERDTPMGASLYLARPIHADPACLGCHSLPAAAPRTLIARYGSDNGFGWQANEIIGAQVVTVPLANAVANAQRAFHDLMLLLLAVFAGLLLAINGILYTVVVRPLRQISSLAETLSLGSEAAGEFPDRGAEEITALGRSFTRMQKSLAKSLQLLGS